MSMCWRLMSVITCMRPALNYEIFGSEVRGGPSPPSAPLDARAGNEILMGRVLVLTPRGPLRS